MSRSLRLRLAVVLSHPTQYYSPWFRWLVSNAELELRVFYLWDFGTTVRRDPQFQAEFRWDVDLLSGYASEFITNDSSDPGTHHIGGLNNPGLCARLEAWGPDALLVFGYKWMSNLRAIAWARRKRVPLIFRGDSHLLGRSRPRLSHWIVLRWLFGKFDAFAYVGRANRSYFETFGVPKEKLFFSPHSVDTQLFDPSRADHKCAAVKLRAELGLPPRFHIVLFAGKLVAAKQPRELLRAFLQMNHPNTALVFVGEGPEKPALVAAASQSGSTAVRFLPFANQSEMPSRYLLADLFVLPSRGLHETWGLAINEAMHMGVPCLVSDRVGCQQDLITPGETGWVYGADENGGLARQLACACETIDKPDALSKIRKAVGSRISVFTYAETSSGILAALHAVCR